MHKYITTWNGTIGQARDLVRVWNEEQKRRIDERNKAIRSEKMRLFFSRGESMRQAREAVLLNH